MSDNQKSTATQRTLAAAAITTAATAAAVAPDTAKADWVETICPPTPAEHIVKAPVHKKHVAPHVLTAKPAEKKPEAPVVEKKAETHVAKIHKPKKKSFAVAQAPLGDKHKDACYTITHSGEQNYTPMPGATFPAIPLITVTEAPPEKKETDCVAPQQPVNVLNPDGTKAVDDKGKPIIACEEPARGGGGTPVAGGTTPGGTFEEGSSPNAPIYPPFGGGGYTGGGGGIITVPVIPGGPIEVTPPTMPITPSIPEPSTGALLLVGGAAVAAVAARRRKAEEAKKDDAGLTR